MDASGVWRELTGMNEVDKPWQLRETEQAASEGKGDRDNRF